MRMNSKKSVVSTRWLGTQVAVVVVSTVKKRKQSRMSSLSKAARRSALSAAKQKEEMETSEPCGLKLVMAARCLGAVALCEAQPRHTAQRSSGALSWRCHWSYTDRKHSKKNELEDHVFSSTSQKKKNWSSGSAVRLPWHALKKNKRMYFYTNAIVDL